jgi:hypothetical protein
MRPVPACSAVVPFSELWGCGIFRYTFAFAFVDTVRYEDKGKLGVLCKFTPRRGSIG